ncbi:MAG: asparagine synthase (glutamine-hydrolyzing) [Proteobacteria bacterium]|nr:asparagine synthase (glutamine-hydrolyzing) [Pseudomonadota bacterium]
MCGIAGQLGGKDARLAPMIGALAHRGPDGIRMESLPIPPLHGEGDPQGTAAFAHARLSIIDLEGGWQPISAAGSTVIGNGEIYNYVELAREHGLDDVLATGSDFEPLLHLYARKGEAAFERLRGMYAFCLVGNDGRAWLARDPFGIKPLYIMEHDGGLAFASEPRAFLKARLMGPVLDEEPGRELIGFNYTLGARTLFKGLRRLVPGEVVQVRDGRIVANWRQGWRTKTAAPAGDETSLLKQLDAVLEDSVKVHQRSDVPYGLFLSGGIDSTAIATLMARLNERPVTAYTCGFDVPEAADERAQAEKVARTLNLDWRETQFGEEDFWRIAPQVAWALDDPTADYATLPTYKLAEAAKGTLTVVLTGEGGDELFGGYGRYRRALRPAWLGGRPAEPRGADDDALARWRHEARGPEGLTPLQRAQWADIQTWLPNDLLLKLDRTLMAHGLEGRTPFLDREVAAFAFNLPDRMKVQGRYGKWLLRKWLERHCPTSEPWARKQGFTVPVEAWIAPRARDIAVRIGQVEAVRKLAPDAAAFPEGRRWPLLFLALWARIHLEGAKPDEAMASLVGTP